MFFSKETIYKVREELIKKYNRELREALRFDDMDDLGIEVAINYYQFQIGRMEKFIQALETTTTFEELKDVLFTYDPMIDDVNMILDNIK